MTVPGVAAALVGRPAASPGLAVLAVLAWHRHALTAADLVAATGLPAVTVLPVLARLEAGGVVESSWRDGTQHEYRLSPSGKLVAEVIAG